MKAKEEKEKRRLAAERKQRAEKAQAADDTLKLVIEGFEKRAARFEKDFKDGSITGLAWLDLLRDEKKRCNHPDWVTKLDTVITEAKAAIAANPGNEVVDAEPTPPETDDTREETLDTESQAHDVPQYSNDA